MRLGAMHPLARRGDLLLSAARFEARWTPTAPLSPHERRAASTAPPESRNQGSPPRERHFAVSRRPRQSIASGVDAPKPVNRCDAVDGEHVCGGALVDLVLARQR